MFRLMDLIVYLSQYISVASSSQCVCRLVLCVQSMGKSLTFEQSVREAIELQKHFRCKNPICETQVWKLKHELDLALLKIDRLNKQIG